MVYCIIEKQNIDITNTKDFETYLNSLTIIPETNYIQPKNKNTDSYRNYIKSISYKIYKETKKYYIVPFYFKNTCKFSKEPFILEPNKLDEFSFKNDIKLREGDQLDCYNKIISECDNKKYFSCLINLGTATGKTILALKLISYFQLKTIIILNTNELVQQWYKRIVEFMPNIKIGIIQGSTIEIENVDIVLCMVRTATMSDKITVDTFSSFGLCIIDEIHNMSSNVYGKIFFKISSKYQIGMSATLNKQNKTDILFRSFLGKVIYSNTGEENTENSKHVSKSLKQKTNIYLYECSFINDIKIPMVNILGESKVNLSLVLNMLSESNIRNEYIASKILDFLQKEPERKFICMSDRISCLTKIHNIIGKDKSTLLIGKMSNNDRKDARNYPIILATYKLVIEGFDEQSINSLVFITPRSNIVQAIGRIYRKKHEITPIILDFVDNYCSIFTSQSKKRIKQYKSEIDNPFILKMI